MNSTDDLERAIGGLRFTTDTALDEHILEDAAAALGRSPGRTTRPRRLVAWGRLAAAAAILIAIGGLVVLSGRSGSVAYASTLR